jgi:hypothetical protein
VARWVSTDGCRVQEDVEDVMGGALDVAMGLRRLKRHLRLCEECVHGADCNVVTEFNRDFAEALEEITAEWGLGA